MAAVTRAVPAPVESAPVVELAGVSHGSLRGVDLVVARGERVGVVGANGAGKTTLLRVCAGLERPASGLVRLGARVGYVPQACGPSLLPWRTVRQNVALALPPGARSDLRLDAVLADVGLPRALASRSPAQLSGGEQQRVALARALVASPELLLLDEPLSALDLPGRFALRALLLERCRAAGASLVLVSHDVDDLVALADRVVVLGGRPAHVLETIAIAHLAAARARALLQAVCTRAS